MSHQGRDEVAAAEWAAATREAFDLLVKARGQAASGPLRPWQVCDHAATKLGEEYADWLNGGDGKMPRPALVVRQEENTRELARCGVPDEWPAGWRVVEAGGELVNAARAVAQLPVAEVGSGLEWSSEAYEAGYRVGRALVDAVAGPSHRDDLQTLADGWGARQTDIERAARYAGRAAEWSRVVGIRQAIDEALETACEVVDEYSR